METTDFQSETITKLNRIAWLSAQDPKKEFSNLMHHFNFDSLLENFLQLDPNKAVGIDGIRKEEYAEDLEIKLENLLDSMRRMAYIPRPVREVLIPKEGKPGTTRPLGISCIEDKIVQKMFQRVLESIYEPTFLECSYGFRPGIGCHHAIKALHAHLFRNDIQTVIDIDLKNYFGTINHELIDKILRLRIKDKKFMRYINRMFKAGVLSEGDLRIDEDGVQQGSICSPIISNVFAHYAIDSWIENTVKPQSKGSVFLVRYADDAVICCQYNEDAIRIKRELGIRLAKFKLYMNEEKTKLVPFDKKLAQNGIKQGTFDFLGFTFYLGTSQKGRIIPKVKTKSKAMSAKLKKMTEWIVKVKDCLPLREIWKTFRAKIRGHIQYYGVTFNTREVNNFVYESKRIVFKWLNRRSQRKSLNWKKFSMYCKEFPLPKVEVKVKLF